MTAWIFSTEPESYPWSRVEREGTVRWDGIRGPLARKHLRTVKAGDPIFGYHASPERAVVCLAQIAGAAYPDPADEAWLAVDVRFDHWCATPVPLAALRADPGLSKTSFLRIPRLSVAPLSGVEEKALRRLCAGTRRK